MAEELTIGIAAPFKGSFAPLGAQITAGVGAAIAAHNKTGKEPTIRLITENDDCKEKGGEQAANRLIGAGAKVVIGHVCWRASLAGAKEYAKAGIIQISPATRYGALTDERAGNSIFRLNGRTDHLTPFLTRTLTQTLKARKLAILHDDSTYGKGIATAVRDAYRKTGPREILFEAIASGTGDHTSAITRMRASGADVLLLAAYHTEAASLVRQLRDKGLDIPILGLDTLQTREFALLSGKADKVYFASPPSALNRARTYAKTEQDRERLTALVKETDGAPLYTLPAYASIEVLLAAYEQTKGSKNRQKAIIETLSRKQFKTIVGPVAFDEKGDADLPSYALYEWRNGKAEEVR